MFCGWAAPIVSAKTGLGGRLDCVHFVSGALPPGPRDLCRPSSWLRAARMFCGWAAPIVSAKTGLGGRLDCVHFVSGALPPGPRDLCRPSSWLRAARMFCGWAYAHCIRKNGARRSIGLCPFCFGGVAPGPPRPLSLPHSGCEQPECFADGLRPLYPQKVSAKMGLGGRLDCVHFVSGAVPPGPATFCLMHGE